MTGKSIQISTRLTPEDAEFLEQLRVDGAESASDKVRALIHEARRKHDGTKDYAAALQLVEDLTAASQRRLKETEDRTGRHSAWVEQMSAWLQESFAYALSHMPDAHDGDEDEDELRSLEQGLVQRGVRLSELLLRLAVTPNAPTYDSTIIQSRIGSIVALAPMAAQHAAPPGDRHERD